MSSRPSLGVRDRAVAQESQRRAEHAGERGEDRDRRLQRPHVVRRGAQQGVALGDRLVDEAELAVLEIADAAVDHVRRRGRGAADEVVALDEGDVHALHGQVAEGREAVDPAADDQHVGVRALHQHVEAALAA